MPKTTRKPTQRERITGQKWYDQHWAPSRSMEDEEYYDLRHILRKARQHKDKETKRKIRERMTQFLLRYPEYQHGCWGSAFL